MPRLRDKRVFQQSPTTTYRERDPTSPRIADSGNPSMVIDFSKQMPVVPKKLGQTTRYGENDQNFRTMNASGKPKALDTMVGGSADPPSDVFGAYGKKNSMGPTKGR